MQRWELLYEKSKSDDKEYIDAINKRLEEMNEEAERFIMLASKSIGK